MRRVVASEFVTLDGVFQDPGGAEGFEHGGWSFKYSRRSEDDANLAGGLLRASDALLLGRVTYEGFAQAWPTMKDGGWYADRMNSLPKYVVSSTLKEAEWNNSKIIKGDLRTEVGELKKQPGGDILVFGSGELVNGLLREGLLDELRLLVSPVVLGSGRRLFTDGGPIGLRVAQATPLASGVVLLVYEFAVNHD
ncbi:MAG TPA: dihydrofolate reductase family protein [Candidatus Dormibacteraeota bacterium]|jgi:dihydrofolate reductase|nr:dihydrofolate reductase family protein [Candidatus Dormibacteraeota bacterium]